MQGLSFSKESLEATMKSLTPATAMRMVALAGGKTNLVDLISRLSVNFNAEIPQSAWATISEASKSWHQASGSRLVKYAVRSF